MDSLAAAMFNATVTVVLSASTVPPVTFIVPIDPTEPDSMRTVPAAFRTPTFNVPPVSTVSRPPPPSMSMLSTCTPLPRTPPF